MQTQCEVKISLEYLFSQKLNSLFFHGLDMDQFIASNGTEGKIRNISSIWKVKDHGSHDLTWKLDTIFNFKHQT
jgi:hypothetical protein